MTSQVLIPNALQPAEVEEVILCQMLGRAIVLVREDQLSLAIGRRGQNVRLASKLCGWDIEIMTREELDEQIEQAVVGFSALDGRGRRIGRETGRRRLLDLRRPVGHRARRAMEMGGLTSEQADHIIGQAETMALEAEEAAAEQRRRQRELERREAAMAQAEEAEAKANAARDAVLAAEAGSDADAAVAAETELATPDETATEPAMSDETPSPHEEAMTEAATATADQIPEEQPSEDHVPEDQIPEDHVPEEQPPEEHLPEEHVLEEQAPEETKSLEEPG